MEIDTQGRYNPAIVVIDPQGDLVRDTLKLVPPSIAHKVRLLDFGGADRVPAVNLIDPHIFPDRDRCVDTVMGTVERFWEHCGGRAHDTLRHGLLIAYEFNSHLDTPRDDMLTMLDIPALLEEGTPGGSGHGARIALNDFQSCVLSRVADRSLQVWFQEFQSWMPSLRCETVGPVQKGIQSYASARRPAEIMGRPGSTIILSDMLEVFSQGQVLLVSTAQSSCGEGPAALMGGALISLVRLALQSQGSPAPLERDKCLLVCEQFHAFPGADWERLLAEARKYGCSLMLATESLARQDTPGRRLKDAVLRSVANFVGYRMAEDDAAIIAPEMDSSRVPERFLTNLDPHHCYVRITSHRRSYPAFSVNTPPPPNEVLGSDESVAAVLRAAEAYTFRLAGGP